MAKADLFQKALTKKLIPEDSKEKDYTIDQLNELLKPTETKTEKVTEDPKVTLFKEAVKIKAVPVGAKIENYSLNKLKSVIDNHKKTLAELEKQQKAEERIKKEDEKAKKKK